MEQITERALALNPRALRKAAMRATLSETRARVCVSHRLPAKLEQEAPLPLLLKPGDDDDGSESRRSWPPLGRKSCERRSASIILVGAGENENANEPTATAAAATSATRQEDLR